MIVNANPYVLKLLDCTLHEIIDKKPWEIGFSDTSKSLEDSFLEKKNTGYINIDSLYLQSKSGLTYEVECIGDVYLADNVKVVQFNIRDITTRR